MGRKTVHTLILLSILLLATGLRFYRLDTQSFWNDEGNAARAAERSIPLILEAAEGDIHPPGYYLLLHFWRGLVGESEFSLRALSALCSILTVALTYGLGRRLLGVPVGIGGALLAALSPLAVYYSQEARMYALLGLLSTASTYLLLFHVLRPTSHVLRSTSHVLRPTSHVFCPTPYISGWIPLVGYVLTAAAGLYTHYAFPFILMVHNLLFLTWWGTRGGAGAGDARMTRMESNGTNGVGASPVRGIRAIRGVRDWRLLAGWAALQGAALLLFAPWLPIALRAVTGWPSAGGGYSVGGGLLDLFRALTVGITMGATEARWGLVVAGPLLLAGLWPERGKVGPVGALAAWLLLPITLILALDLYKPAYLKFLLVVLPPFHLLLAHGTEQLSRLTSDVSRSTFHASRLTLYAFLLFTAPLPSLHNLYFDPAYARDDYRQIAADIEAAARPGDGIILDAPNQWEVFTYYHREGAPVYPIPRSRPPRADEVARELAQIGAAHRRLFVLYWGEAEADPQRLVEGWLAAHAYPAGDRWYGTVRVAVYGLGPLPEEPAVPLEARFGEGIWLRGYAVGEGPFAPGDVVGVTLFWEADAPVTERYKVFLHLLDGGGNLVAQNDAEPLGNLLPTDRWEPGEMVVDRHGVLLPPGLPPGEYTLVAGLYHLISGERLLATPAEGPPSDHLPLGSIAVSP
jgi:hypothetical protein